MFSDIIPHRTMSKLHFYMDLMYHTLLGHAKVCLSSMKNSHRQSIHGLARNSTHGLMLFVKDDQGFTWKM